MSYEKDIDLAIKEYFGYGELTYPQESKIPLIEVFGADKAPELLKQIEEILGDLQALKPDWSVHTLSSSGAWAKEEVSKIHPHLSNPSLDVLEWVFTWWWK